MNLGNLAVTLSANPTNFMRVMNSAQRSLIAFKSSVTSVGASLLKFTGITSAIGAIGGGGFGLYKAITAYGDFDDAMTKSLAIMSNVSPEMRKQMEDVATQISLQTTTSAEDLAKAYYYLASAGLNASQSMAALGTVEAFARAGVMDLARATEVLVGAQKAMGLSSENATENMRTMTQVSDVLVKASTLANANVEQFAEALTNKAAAAMSQVGMSIEEGVAALAVYADKNTKGAEAGTKLEIVLRELQRSVLDNKEAWDYFNLSVYDTEEALLPLYDIVRQLENAFSKMSSKQKTATADMLGFRAESFSALSQLLGSSKVMESYYNQLAKVQGVTKDVADKQLQSFNAQMQILMNHITAIGKEIGSLLIPYIKKMMDKIKESTPVILGFFKNFGTNMESIMTWLKDNWDSFWDYFLQRVEISLGRYVTTSIAAIASVGQTAWKVLEAPAEWFDKLATEFDKGTLSVETFFISMADQFDDTTKGIVDVWDKALSRMEGRLKGAKLTPFPELKLGGGAKEGKGSAIDWLQEGPLGKDPLEKWFKSAQKQAQKQGDILATQVLDPIKELKEFIDSLDLETPAEKFRDFVAKAREAFNKQLIGPEWFKRMMEFGEAQLKQQAGIMEPKAEKRQLFGVLEGGNIANLDILRRTSKETMEVRDKNTEEAVKVLHDIRKSLTEQEQAARAG